MRVKARVAGAIFAALLVGGCSQSAVNKFDSAHAVYNAAAGAAMDYADDPLANKAAGDRIAEIVVRTGPLVIRGSNVVSRYDSCLRQKKAGVDVTCKLDSGEKALLAFTREAVDEALEQLAAFYAGELATEEGR